MAGKFARAAAVVAILSLVLLGISGADGAPALYWESPAEATRGDARFPKTVSDGDTVRIFFEEVDRKNAQVWISLTSRKEGELRWAAQRRVAGPFPYSGEDVPDLFSAAISKGGKIALSVLTSKRSLGVYVSSDGCRTFSFREFTEQENALVGPRIFGTSTGGFMLFASLGEPGGEGEGGSGLGSFSILCARSDDGEKWGELSEFAPSRGITNPFVPFLSEFTDSRGRRGDIVLFQGFAPSSAIFQIYMSVSYDSQRTWSEPRMLTVHPQYRSQRPFVFTDEQGTCVAWERTETRSDKSQIMFAELKGDGALSEEYEITSERAGGDSHRPEIFRYGDRLRIVWFDDRRGVDGIYMAERNGKFWSESVLAAPKSNCRFASPMFAGGEIAFAWQQDGGNGEGRIVVLETDRSVKTPKITAAGFREGKRSTAERAAARVALPEDSSGIAGYTWIWTQDRHEEPPKDTERLSSPKDTSISGIAPGDGIWYFKARAYDYAGNWSDTATLAYHRDLTPPQPPAIEPVDEDRYGFASTNDLTVRWRADDVDDDVAGYSWTMTPIGSLPKNLQVNATHPLSLPDSRVEQMVADTILKYTSENTLRGWLGSVRPPRRLMGGDTSASYKNPENGVYIFSVCAIDEVGNIGEASHSLLLLNKYVPSTKILNVTQKTDEEGTVRIDITGEGFLYDGTVSEVVVESDGGSRYVFSLERGDYRVESDERISGITLRDMKEGGYSVSVRHTDRGAKAWNGTLRVSQSGMVRHENRYFFEPEWRVLPESRRGFTLEVPPVALTLAVLLASLSVLAGIRGIGAAVRDAAITKEEVRALLNGGKMPMERRERYMIQGMSLKWKLIGFTSLLIAGVVTLVAVSLGRSLSRNQERTLLEGLQDRVNVVMESMATGVRNYLPEAEDKTNEIMLLPSQTKFFPEANWATVTGLGADGSNSNLDFVWSSNDPEIESKIDSGELRQGVSRLTDADGRIFGVADALNAEAVEQVREISERMEAIRAEKAGADERRNEELNSMLAELRNEIDERLNTLSVDAQSSIPAFSAQRLDRAQESYLFYKPVLFRMSGDNETFVRSFVLMEVSTNTVRSEIDKAIREIVVISIALALVAIVLGSVGMYFLASIIVNPIRKLVRHVRKIGDTQDKEELDGLEVEIGSRDEIRTLGDAVNEMTRGLVKAAKDEKELARQQEENIKERERTAKAQEDAAREKERAAEAQAQAQAIQEQMLRAQEADLKNKLMESDGRRIQTGFIPLNTVPRSDVKDTIASYRDENVDLFCYYEGSDSLSGDYFSYRKLEGGWYALMKCDVSGHGVPASLLTTILATGFNGYFGNWTLKKNGTRLNELALSLNESIGNLNLRGKFATLLIALFDSNRDEIYLCHAGDNIVRMYDSRSNRQKTITLEEAGAAGSSGSSTRWSARTTAPPTRSSSCRSRRATSSSSTRTASRSRRASSRTATSATYSRGTGPTSSSTRSSATTG